jgi:signal transduction histidine kinase/HAMP domain-containing protein/ActR/RegA family two-component response regulator
MVFLAIAPAWVVIHLIAKHTGTEPPWASFVVGMVALGAAWAGGERFILRQVRRLLAATQRLAAGDLSSRTGLGHERGELGELAATFDGMAQALEQRVRERERTEKMLLNRSFQQTVVSALGQFALVSSDISALLNQAVHLATQTLEVEYGSVFELLPGERELLLKTGVGWREGLVGQLTVSADRSTQAGFTLAVGEPVVVEYLPAEARFDSSPLLKEHGVVSGITVAVPGQERAYGILGAYTTNRRVFTEDEVHFLLAIATVLAMAVARNQTEAQLRKLAAFVQLHPNPAMELDAEARITYANEAAHKLAALVGLKHPGELLPQDIRERVQDCLAAGRSLARHETRIEGHALAWSFHPVVESQAVHCYVEDITGRLSLEAQLRQAQKMESVGQLAAGVAHDFNNMLTVIQGHSGMLLAKTGLPPGLLDSAKAIFYAAERAASLTRQLLVFSRKNVMQVQQLDLREVVGNMSKMLERLLGETIALQFKPPARIPLIRGDNGMVEQVLMNLAVNARDAMPNGGTLTIQADVVDVDQAYAQAHPEARAGPSVCLRVMDTGCGMDAATLGRIFEPFFTTKEVGKGTGLGLATVYGIVKRHGGWIEVASTPGLGTSFAIFFPACTEPVWAKAPQEAPAPETPAGKETLLVVEDEPVLREMAHVILEDCGYKILEAASGRKAIEMWNEHPGAIDLLLTDMVMPEGISGMDLAQRLQASNPKLKIVFASGYSMDDLDTSFLRQGRATFLQKPYTHASLAKAVRDCLDNRG